jgi:hypothetical protein
MSKVIRLCSNYGGGIGKLDYWGLFNICVLRHDIFI